MSVGMSDGEVCVFYVNNPQVETIHLILSG